jgi:hypothetical protein
MTVSGNYALGFVCQGDNARFVYITPEKYSDKLSASMGLLGPKLLVRVDDADVVKLDVMFEDANGLIKMLTDDESASDLAVAVSTAKKRVAIAVELGGQLFHKTNFGVSGSKDAVGKSLNGCNSEKKK